MTMGKCVLRAAGAAVPGSGRSSATVSGGGRPLWFFDHPSLQIFIACFVVRNLDH